MAGWDDMMFGNLPRRYSQPATPGAQLPVLTDDGSTWPQTQPAAPQAGQGQGSGYWWPQILQSLWNTAKSGVTLPGDVATGKASMADPATQNRVGDMASVAMLAAGAAPAEPDALNMGIRAYHGSPYDFDRFDMSKIGTGEGHQSYGHGLYFAENEDVAKTYRDTLSQGFTDKQGNPLPQRVQQDLDQYLPYEHWKSGDVATGLPAAIQRLQRLAAYDPQYAVPAERLKAIDPSNVKKAGSTYQVDINAEPEQFLDWDKPLSEQHPTVENAAADLAAKMRQPMGNATGEAFYQNLIAAHQAESGNLPIGDASARGASRASAASAVSERLRDAGIPGIKYLDQGSRNLQILSPDQTVHGQWLVKQIPNGNVLYRGPDEAAAREAYGNGGSHNYVTFSDDIINMLKKYGLAGLGLTAGAGALTTQRPSPAEAGTTLGGGR